VLGNYAAQVEGSVADLICFLDAEDTSQFTWSACCFGRNEQLVMLKAYELGGHVRLGFENNLWRPDGRLSSDNTQQIVRFVSELPTDGRKPATAEEVRNTFF